MRVLGESGVDDKTAGGGKTTWLSGGGGVRVLGGSVVDGKTAGGGETWLSDGGREGLGGICCLRRWRREGRSYRAWRSSDNSWLSA